MDFSHGTDAVRQERTLNVGEFFFTNDTQTLYFGDGDTIGGVAVDSGAGEDIAALWGNIGGVLANQSDLQSALDGKASSAQGSVAASATQPGDNVSTLTNDAGYITSAPSLVEIGGYSELTAAATSVNASTHNYTAISGTQTLSFTNVPNGAYSCTVVITAGTITWPANIKWMGGAAPTLTANEDIITLMTVDNGTNWFGSYSLGYA